MGKKLFPIIMFALLIAGCGREEFTQLVVSAQLNSTDLDTLKLNLSFVVVTKASLEDIGEIDAPVIEPPEPGDSCFECSPLPDVLEPIEGATVVFAGDTLNDLGGGFYQGIHDTLVPLTRYELSIETPDGDVHGHVILPGAFSIIYPDSVTIIPADSISDVTVEWTRSDSANCYLVRMVKDDGTQMVSEIVEDTTYTIDAGKFESGASYVISVTAIYGKFEAGVPGLSDLLEGAIGFLSATLTTKPVVVTIQ